MNLKIDIFNILRILIEFTKFIIFTGWPVIIGTLITAYFFYVWMECFNFLIYNGNRSILDNVLIYL